ncbi:hypothetical protein KUTeg_012603 [Tegillarca granosa]|uniref:Uncharacterized protein n=1 Tax=Tegillarca granosa TaxID=220873 RepID=A0ABQ9F590_TEGGR|nr:hypothetical protein KUTeg_012603 [Tegillarca granosa]
MSGTDDDYNKTNKKIVEKKKRIKAKCEVCGEYSLTCQHFMRRHRRSCSFTVVDSSDEWILLKYNAHAQRHLGQTLMVIQVYCQTIVIDSVDTDSNDVTDKPKKHKKYFKSPTNSKKQRILKIGIGFLKHFIHFLILYNFWIWISDFDGIS